MEHFWKDQPLIKLKKGKNTVTFDEGTEIRDISDFATPNPIELPSGYSWHNINTTSNHDIDSIYTLLRDNYVTDSESTITFLYSKDLIRWILGVPVKGQHYIGIKNMKMQLVALVTAIPITLFMKGRDVDTYKVTFLCIDEKYRKSGLSYSLFGELKRRIINDGKSHCVFTTSFLMAMPFCRCQYYHKPINVKKLLQCGFISLKKNVKPSMLHRLYRINNQDTLKTGELEEVTNENVVNAYDFYNTNNKFYVTQKFTLDEFKHYFASGIVKSFINRKDGIISDFVSYYMLPSRIIEENNTIDTAYLFYSVFTSPEKIIKKIINTICLSSGCDVLNLTNTNYFTEKLLKDLKCKLGTGQIYYYFYNMNYFIADNDVVNLCLV